MFSVDVLVCFYVMVHAIWYHLYNLKTVKNNHGGVLLLIKLELVVFIKNFLYEEVVVRRCYIIKKRFSEKMHKNYRETLTLKSHLNPFHTTGPFLYPLKTLGNIWFSGVFRGIKGDQWYEMGR